MQTEGNVSFIRLKAAYMMVDVVSFPFEIVLQILQIPHVLLLFLNTGYSIK